MSFSPRSKPYERRRKWPRFASKPACLHFADGAFAHHNYMGYAPKVVHPHPKTHMSVPKSTPFVSVKP